MAGIIRRPAPGTNIFALEKRGIPWVRAAADGCSPPPGRKKLNRRQKKVPLYSSPR
jgi:hypothetical protein